MKKLLLLIVLFGLFSMTSCTDDELSLDESLTEIKQDENAINHDEIGGSTDDDDTDLDTAGD